ncbi:SpoIIE family protein phosphatase [Tunturiibacter gelidoferens]|uniref:Serine phosphatase RsbU (Regulator of sigma subunit) n=1 Tax=Tunturiibacter gelidiferens TaxID=3069689 RepID=A0A9X0Q9P5_9BACT|nr:SpoIIE family protein phosphatase [Edaphobacter lichenicola]MBB5326641.1 serine phosphatase RsbU (regulator of sigma subunit) [Edaphobacter lichenicola]
MTQVNQKTVLVVDDAPANIQIVNSILKDTYKVRVATSGSKALELVKVIPLPDLILLDVVMPEMDGYEVCTRLKLDPETRDIPVIFLTGQTEVEDETKGFDVGAVDYIHKPFSPAVVKARVQTHLTLRGIREQLSQQLLAIQKELETARQIQLSILPSSIPKIAGLDIAARYVPMTSVAGDFYDFIVVDEEHLGVLVADVSGHGMPAALIASMIKIAFSSQASHAADPARVLLGLNEALCGKFEHHFVTAAYVFIDIQNRTLTYAGAGHPPLLLWGAEGVRSIEENGLFLGKFSFATYTSKELPLTPGDRILLYTDGIPETTNPAGIEFGADGFRQFLENEQTATSATQFADRLLEELSLWSGRGSSDELDDDMTIVAIHVASH